jgi:hypothetical protein
VIKAWLKIFLVPSLLSNLFPFLYFSKKKIIIIIIFLVTNNFEFSLNSLNVTTNTLIVYKSAFFVCIVKNVDLTFDD